MRIRQVKPEFWRSGDIAKLDYFTRLLYIGLWNYVDDNGVGEDDEALIRSDLFPRDDVLEVSGRITVGLQELYERGHIARYECRESGRRYLAVLSWQHQYIPKPTKSSKPLPTSENVTLLDLSGSGTVAIPEDYRLGLGVKGSRDQGVKGSRDLGVGGVPGGQVEKATAPTARRGTRLPGDWKPSKEVVDQLGKQFPQVNQRAEYDKFCDYWRAKSGKDAAKLDWDATWRNWIRNAAERTPQGQAQQPRGADAKAMRYANRLEPDAEPE